MTLTELKRIQLLLKLHSLAKGYQHLQFISSDRLFKILSCQFPLVKGLLIHFYLIFGHAKAHWPKYGLSGDWFGMCSGSVIISVVPAARGLPLCLSIMRPFQGAHSTPHSWVIAKALMYWLTAETHRQRGFIFIAEFIQIGSLKVLYIKLNI